VTGLRKGTARGRSVNEILHNPQVQSLIRNLRVGEQVDIVYEEALAVSVEPMR